MTTVYEKPKTRRRNKAITRDFTKRLAGFAALIPGAEMQYPMGRNARRSTHAVFPSGNAGEDDDAFTFEVEIDGLLFNVEVFGPYYEGGDS